MIKHIKAPICVFAAIIIMAGSSGCRSIRNNNKDPNSGMEPINPTEFGEDNPLPQGDFALEGEALTAAETGYFDKVFFKLDAHNIASSEVAKIRAVAEFLADKPPSIVVVIEGHCDERGTTEYNITLGETRALNVRDRLIAYGISPGRIQTVSFGKEKPADMRHNESAWSQNRRAEFVFYKLR